ncbi:hypothetical protein MKX08_007778 [Trichoderma sp. CBMAI-0020]|nr:hypothetical protein MKX08_007778 [Trichoderma sp. CBMAI-0020]
MSRSTVHNSPGRELACSRGIDESSYGYIEYDHKYTVFEDMDPSRYRQMASTSRRRYHRLRPAREFKHIYQQSNTLEQVFPSSCMSESNPHTGPGRDIKSAMTSIIAVKSRSGSLPTKKAIDVASCVDARLFSSFSPTVLKVLSQTRMAEFIGVWVSCKNNVSILGTLLETAYDEAGKEEKQGQENVSTAKYEIPCLADGSFTGDTLAALPLVFLTYWIDKS